MKSLVVAGSGCLALLAVASLDGPERTTRSESPSPQPASLAPAAYDLSFLDGPNTPSSPAGSRTAGAHPVLRRKAPTTTMSNVALGDVVKKTCAGCHSEQRRQGNLSLQNFDLATIGQTAPEVAEKMINKLRTGMMPPPGRARPGGDTLDVLLNTLERTMDTQFARNPNAGSRAFQRLNRAEYERAVKDLLAIEVKAGTWLPLDTKSANFDNIADVQLPSATLLDSYLDAASEIARLAVGDPRRASPPAPTRSRGWPRSSTRSKARPSAHVVARRLRTPFRPTASTCSPSPCTPFRRGSCSPPPRPSMRRSKCR